MARPITPTPKLDRSETVQFLNKLYENQDKKELIDLMNSVKKVRERKNQQVG
jgi:hypothetical protein